MTTNLDPQQKPATVTTRWPLFCCGYRWFRIMGYGVRYVDHRTHRMFFSERYGYRRGLHIGSHCFMFITPRRAT